MRRYAPGSWLVLYLAAAVLLYGRDLHWLRDHIGDSGADPLTAVWFLAWWPWAIAHGADPLFTRLDWAPSGYPLTWATSIPTLSLLALPVTLLANAVASYNVLTATAPALSAWSCYLLARMLTGHERASVLAGFLFGFSSYENGQMLGHLNLVCTWLVPLLVALCVGRTRNAIARPHFVLLFAAGLVMEFGISTEMTLSFVVLGFAVIGIFALGAPPFWSGRLRGLSIDIMIGGCIAIAVVSPWLLAMWRSAAQMPSFVNSPASYSTDLLNLVIPTPLTLLFPQVFPVAGRFTGNASEQGAYIGLPLLLILGVLGAATRREWTMRALSLSTLMLIAASLGPTLWVAGVRTGIILPWRAATSLPFLDGMLPCRFMEYAWLGIAMSVALWISRRPQSSRLLVAACASLSLLPDPRYVAWSRMPTLPFFAPDHIRKKLGPHANVVMLPFGSTGPGMAWQWQSGMRFSQAGGALSFIPLRFQSPVVLALEKGTTYAQFAADFRAFCRSNDVSFVLIGPGSPPALVHEIEQLGWPEEASFSVRVLTTEPFSRKP